MKNQSLLRLSLLSLGLLQACGGMPTSNAGLDAATQNFQAAQRSPTVAALAPAELKDAELSLANAIQAWTNNGPVSEVDHLAYLARQKTAIAQEAAAQRQAENAVAQAAAGRNQILLAARTQEAEAAQRSVEGAEQQARLAWQQSEQAKREASLANLSAATAQMQTDAARQRTAQLEQRLAALNAKRTERGMVVTIGDILFETASAGLKSSTGNSVERLGEFLLAYPTRTAAIEGYTDSVGSTQSNQELSERRAATVRAALLRMGVQGGRLSVVGYGETYPAASNGDAEGRMANRRVEVVLSDEAGLIPPR
jgi:outer membrane protein OmpA-like peptidoglycan-associated protein